MYDKIHYKLKKIIIINPLAYLVPGGSILNRVEGRERLEACLLLLILLQTVAEVTLTQLQHLGFQQHLSNSSASIRVNCIDHWLAP